MVAFPMTFADSAALRRRAPRIRVLKSGVLRPGCAQVLPHFGSRLAVKLLGNVCPDGSVETAMDRRNRSQNVERVLLGNLPVNFGGVAHCIAKRSEQAIN